MSSGKIRVEPVALGPANGGYQYTGFYPLGCLVAYAKVYGDGALGEGVSEVVAKFQGNDSSPQSC